MNRRLRGKAAVIMEPIDRHVILWLDDMCHLCDTPVDPEQFHLDHIIPVAIEPLEAAWNYAVAHPRCNQSKGGQLAPLSPTARARWQERRPEHLALLDEHLARLAA